MPERTACLYYKAIIGNLLSRVNSGSEAEDKNLFKEKRGGLGAGRLIDTEREDDDFKVREAKAAQMLNWGAEATRLTNNGQGAKSTQFFVKDRRARKAVNSSLQEKGKKLLVMH